MRTRSTLLALLLALLPGLTLPHPAPAEPAAHPALAAWARAWQANDAEALAELYEPHARVLLPDARSPAVGGRAVALALGQDCDEVAERRLELTRHHWTELAASGAAVSSGTAWVTILTSDGDRTHLSLRFSMVWVVSPAGWRILDQHLSLLPFDDE